jgi:hypothetical protein
MEERRKKTVNFVVLPLVRCRPQYYSGTIFTFSRFSTLFLQKFLPTSLVKLC